jgi:hypothetical protein
LENGVLYILASTIFPHLRRLEVGVGIVLGATPAGKTEMRLGRVVVVVGLVGRMRSIHIVVLA